MITLAGSAAAAQWTTTRSRIFSTGWWIFLITLGSTVTFLPRDATAGAAVKGSNSMPPVSFVELGFSEEPSDSAVAENAPVVLHCAAFSTPHVGNPQIRWHKDGLPVELDEKRHRLHANGSLYLNSVQRRSGRTDEGQYHCLASLPDVGTIISRPARLVITYSIPTFEEQPQNVSLYAGQTAFFPCSVSQDRAHRSPRVTWLRNGAPLRLDPLKMVQLPSGALEIDALVAHDEGQYQCQVTTGDKVRLSSVGSLKVLPTPQPGSVENERRIPSAPVFIAQPSQVRAVKGDQVTLDCAANGHPRPHISWLKDGASIDMSNLDSRFRLVGVGSLQIESVQSQDAGSYMCRAENREDSLDASATLTVLVPPTFRAKPTPQAVREKEDALFECDVFGVPEPKVQWFKNGESVLITGYFQLVNGHNLRILGSVHNDRGVYQCLAENQAGTAQASAQLVVLDKDKTLSLRSLSSLTLGGSPGNTKEAPSAPRGLTAQLVTANIISLSWQSPLHNADGIITYTVLYKAEGSTRERVQNTTQHKLDEIIIKNLKPSTKYYFRVVAVDKAHGMGESSEPIAVETNADIANNVVGPPLNVRANPISTNQIAVTWDPPAALPPRTIINYYEVYYQEMSASSFVHEEQKMTSRTSPLTLDNLTTFAEYTIWVNAVTPNGTGVSSSEVVARTFSDTPSESPQNVTLEKVNGGTSLIVRWEPPPREQQNGILTGYKIRYKQPDQRDRRRGEIITTDGNRRSHTIENLKKGEVYMVKIAALTVNGTGPATDWISTDSYRAEPEENNVPDQPSYLRTKASSRSITVGWLPPRETNIMVRGYRIGWGPGIPDVHTSKLEGKQRYFTIENLQPMTEYVISVRAYNRIGEGQSLQDTVRTLPEAQVTSPASLVPPVGLKAVVLSPTTVVLFWSDTTIPLGQTNGNRQYQVRYKAVSSSKYKFANSTQLNCMIDELRPYTQYEFAVRVVLRGRRESAYSMAVLNTTHEAVPESAPRDFTIDEDSEPGTVTLHWGPPKVSNGIITSYSIAYTTEPSLKDRDWLMEVVSGDKLTTSISGLHTDNRYYFKIYANTSKGAGPMSDAVAHHTGKRGLFASNVTLLVGAGVGLILFLLLLTACALPCRRKDPTTTQSARKDKTSKMVAGTTSLGDEKPPDLWIHHHDQMELKTCKGENLPPDGVTSNRNSQDVSSIEDHYLGTLDKKKSLYMDSGASDSGGSSSCRTDRPLLPKYPTSNHSRPTSVDPALKPLLYSSPSIEPGSSATLGRPYHQRASNQYSTGPRAHIMMDSLPHHIDGLTTLSRHHPLPSSTYETVMPPLPGVMPSHGAHTLGGHGSQMSGGGQVPSYTSALLAANAAAAASLASQQHQQPPPPPPPHIVAGYDTIGRQQRSAQGAAGFNQMRSFSVPSGTQGGPSTPPPPKHVVVRPQPSSAGGMMHNSGSPQKGASAGAPGAGAPHAMKRVLVPNGAPPGLRDDLNTPFNEELDAQMANLDCLMKDLNGVIVSSSEFEC
ncbi:neogenin-like isoform X2 [Varroa destructor]|uniref:Neogenin n=1 Tax=Varroa destructor TaxID=109461 RepID=A0A7M7K8B1_VARDE|nr:neogenin-like isoform X2 [Varroa destructor]